MPHGNNKLELGTLATTTNLETKKTSAHKTELIDELPPKIQKKIIKNAFLGKAQSGKGGYLPLTVC